VTEVLCFMQEQNKKGYCCKQWRAGIVSYIIRKEAETGFTISYRTLLKLILKRNISAGILEKMWVREITFSRVL